MKEENITQREIAEIIEAIAMAMQAGAGQIDCAALQIKRCIDVGEMLFSLKKRVKHGKFLALCEELSAKVKSSGVSYRTLNRWMRLYKAKEKGTLDLTTANGVRNAYQLAGIVPESDHATGSKSAEAMPFYMLHVVRLNACIERLDVATLGSEEKQLLRERLKPITRLYASLE